MNPHHLVWLHQSSTNSQAKMLHFYSRNRMQGRQRQFCVLPWRKEFKKKNHRVRKVKYWNRASSCASLTCHLGLQQMQAPPNTGKPLQLQCQNTSKVSSMMCVSTSFGVFISQPETSRPKRHQLKLVVPANCTSIRFTVPTTRRGNFKTLSNRSCLIVYIQVLVLKWKGIFFYKKKGTYLHKIEKPSLLPSLRVETASRKYSC